MLNSIGMFIAVINSVECMKSHAALKIILSIGLVGVLFSGYLSYSELVASKCILGGCSYVLGLPACVYGFVMYTIVFVVALLGIRSKK